MFGLITLATLEVNMYYAEVFGKLLFGVYNVATKILLLNMLIAMMSKSFHTIVVSKIEFLNHKYQHIKEEKIEWSSKSLPFFYTMTETNIVNDINIPRK